MGNSTENFNLGKSLPPPPHPAPGRSQFLVFRESPHDRFIAFNIPTNNKKKNCKMKWNEMKWNEMKWNEMNKF